MFGGQHSPSVLSPSRAEPDVRSLSADLSSWEEYQEQSHNITLRPSLSLSLALSRYILRVVSRSFLASSSLVTGPRARCQAEISWPGVHRNLRLYLTFCHINIPPLLRNGNKASPPPPIPTNIVLSHIRLRPEWSM